LARASGLRRGGCCGGHVNATRFLEEVPEFVIAVPDQTLRAAAKLCGTASGRDLDKFAAAGLTRVPSAYVRAPSILECPINVECRIYASIAPPHLLLTPEHRQQPVEEQHSIYFAEVLATCTYAGREGSAGRRGSG
jgi:flavin reductase (DIM6/NTAB) family NADH-FMN oxidoreductase RutF